YLWTLGTTLNQRTLQGQRRDCQSRSGDPIQNLLGRLWTGHPPKAPQCGQPCVQVAVTQSFCQSRNTLRGPCSSKRDKRPLSAPPLMLPGVKNLFLNKSAGSQET